MELANLVSPQSRRGNCREIKIIDFFWDSNYVPSGIQTVAGLYIDYAIQAPKSSQYLHISVTVFDAVHIGKPVRITSYSEGPRAAGLEFRSRQGHDTSLVTIMSRPAVGESQPTIHWV
jgi:hypothetical protein